MKKHLFATAFTAAALFAAPALAASGYVGVDAAHSEVEIAGVEGDGEAYGLSGAVAMPVSETIGLELDGSIAQSDTDGDDLTVYSATAHVYQMTDSGRFGAFGGLAAADDVATWSVGLEGQGYTDKVNLGGAIGYVRQQDADLNAWGAAGSVDYFVSDNLSVGANVALAVADVSGFDGELWNVGVDAEYLIPSLPVSIYGAYDHSESDDIDMNADTFSVGVRFNFGAGSLKERSRQGPGLGSADRLTAGLL